MSFVAVTDSVSRPSSSDESQPIVDIVAVHGLDEDARGAWTHQPSGVLWLKDILPDQHLIGRLRVFQYGSDPASTHGKGSSDRILSYATTLVTSLAAERDLDNARKRPIVFICHGFGGILVKQALVYSKSKRALVYSQSGFSGDDSRRSIFVSTCAILFFGTPHTGLREGLTKLSFHQRIFSEPNQLLQTAAQGSEVLQDITDQFSSILKRFLIWCFWEQVKTRTKSGESYIVEQDSAAMTGEDVQRSGLPASHSQMCKFSNATDPGFNVVLAALKRIFEEAPSMIEERWRDEKKTYREELRSQEKAVKQAQALLRSDSMPLTPDSPTNTVNENEFFIVPRPAVSIFTGHYDLSVDLRKKLLQPNQKTTSKQNKIFVIHGIGGSGKTQFCLKFVEEVRSHFWGIFWIDASSHESLEAGFSNLGREAKKDSTLDAGKYWLSCAKKPWLLVLDNADDPKMDVSGYFPSSDKGHIILTTRNPEVCMHATIGSKKLWEMDAEDAITLLLKSATSPGSSDYADAAMRKLARPIADTLGCLALALTQAGTSIRRNICTFESYPEQYSTHWKDVMRSPTFRGKLDYRCTISTTWEVPFRQISQDRHQSHLDAVEIVYVFAFLHFDQLPASMFKRAWTNKQQKRITKGAPGVAERFKNIFSRSKECFPAIANQDSPFWDNSRFAEALSILSSYGILEHNASSDTCTLHPVVQAWARDRLNPDTQRHWLEISTNVLADSISTNFEPSGRSYRRSVKLHIDACFRRWEEYNLPFPTTAAQAAIAKKFAAIYAENGIWTRARDIYKTTSTLQESLFGKEHDETLKSLADLGHSYWNLDERQKALDTHLKVYQTRVRILSSEDARIYISLVDLTRSCWLNGKLDDSKKYGERATDGLIESLGLADYQTLNAKHNLGRTYLHLGLLQEANAMLSETLELRQRFFGDSHADTLETMNELGMSFYGLRRLEEAHKLVDRTLWLRKNILGEHHAYTLWSVNDLSKILSDEGNPLQARAMLEEILPVVKETLGLTHVGMLMTKYNLARVNISLGDFEAAEDCFRELTQIQDPRHPDWFKAMSGLARTLEQQHKYLQAEQAWKEAVLKILRNNPRGFEDREVKRALVYLGRNLKRSGRENELELFKKEATTETS